MPGTEGWWLPKVLEGNEKKVANLLPRLMEECDFIIPP